jgi:hypothetical protein
MEQSVYVETIESPINMRFHTREGVVILALWAVLVASRTAWAETWDLSALRALADLTKDQWTAMIHGDPQAKVLNTQEKREVAVVGVARLRATTACFVAKFKEIENFKKNPAVLRIRRFVPTLDSRDLEGFSLEVSDLTDLRVCRVGNCKVDWSPFLRQTVRTHFSSNGELSHGIVTQAVHAGV